MIEINTREELYNYLKNVSEDFKKETPLSCVYYLVEFDGKELPLYFIPYKGVYFESPCVLNSRVMSEQELYNYVLDRYVNESFKDALAYETLMQRDNIHYEIDCPQVEPFLSMPCKIKSILSETECLDYLLSKN